MSNPNGVVEPKALWPNKLNWLTFIYPWHTWNAGCALFSHVALQRHRNACKGKKSETHADHHPCLELFFMLFSSTDGGDSFYNISQFISSEPDPFHFSLFSLNIILLLTAGRNDRPSQSTLWWKKIKVSYPSLLTSLQSCEGKHLHNTQCCFNANVQVCRPSGPRGAFIRRRASSYCSITACQVLHHSFCEVSTNCQDFDPPSCLLLKSYSTHL